MKRLSLLSLILVGASLSSARAQEAPPAPSIPTLWLIGDSTVKNGTAGQMGWGTRLPDFFDDKKIKIENRARGGRSSRTYFTEGLWDAALKDIKAGDFVIMQFGHNDGGGTYTGPRGRSSIKGSGEETKEVTHEDGKTETVHTYGWYLRRYVTDSKAKGAFPIVCSPIPRNRWGTTGKVDRSTDYGVWAKEIATSEKVPFVNLNERLADKYDAMGQEKVVPLFFGDWTHTSPDGATLNAATVVEGLKALEGNPLGAYLK
jgi:lysophospholipase L1-like esterase